MGIVANRRAHSGSFPDIDPAIDAMITPAPPGVYLRAECVKNQRRTEKVHFQDRLD